MIVVSSREFRANQRKYFDLARVNDVVITSRSHGSYRLVPILEDDTIISNNEKSFFTLRENHYIRVFQFA